MKYFGRLVRRYCAPRAVMKVKPENIATNGVTSPKTLDDSLGFQYGKVRREMSLDSPLPPPLLPIKSYAAVESELMKEIEKLQLGRTCPLPPAWPFAHRITFPLIDFFFSSLSPPVYPFPLRSSMFSPSSIVEIRNERKTSREHPAASTPRNNLPKCL